jgi:hypothetical protein
VWKTILFSKIGSHKVVAVILVIVAAVSGVVVVYKFTSFTILQGESCPWYSTPFQASTLPPRTEFQLVPPGKVIICFTAQISGNPPAGGISLSPYIGLYTYSARGTSNSACFAAETNCGGVNVSAIPAASYFSLRTFHVVATINAPAGSTRGIYWVFFAPGCTLAMMWLRIVGQGQTLQPPPTPMRACPLPPSYRVGITFNSYAGMTPVYQNGTAPLFL